MIGKIYCTDIFINKKLKEEDKYVISSKLFNIFDNPNIVCHMLLQKYNILKLKINATTNNISEARNKEEECSICYNKLDTDLYTCHICSNAIHNTCLDIWIKTNNTCIFCRNTVENNLKKSKYLNISK